MANWLKKLSFRGKMLGTYFLLLLLTLIIFVICYVQGVSAALTHHIEYMCQANEQKNINLDIAMGSHSSLNLIHFIDSKVNIILHETVHEMEVEKRFERDSYLSKTLRMLTSANPNIRRISILTEKGDFYTSVSQNAEAYVDMMRAAKDGIIWPNKSQRYYTLPYPLTIGWAGYSAVTVIHQMADIGRADNFAYLLVDLDFGAIAEDFNATSEAGAGNISTSFALFREDEVIYNSRNAHINLEKDLSRAEKARAFGELAEIAGRTGGSGEVEINGVRCVAAVAQNEPTGWYLVHYIPKQLLLSSSMGSMIRAMVWGMLILAAAGVLSIILSRQLSAPIRKLSATMSQARQGQVRLYPDENPRADEVGELIASYNAMGKRINDSIAQVYIAQLNQKQAELKMLQFQINPHFLYNALNTVTAIARLADVEEIPAITESLSDMFRYSIKGEDFVSLKEEITQLQNYLRIQSVRFPGRFFVEYHIPDELLECGVIKFILQPIAENSIHHAFREKRVRDSLRIFARREGPELLLLSVYDDGCGIAPGETRRLNRMLSEMRPDTVLGEDGQGIGLANVNARIKNFYGAHYGLFVESEYGKFTCIHMRLKIRK